MTQNCDNIRLKKQKLKQLYKKVSSKSVKLKIATEFKKLLQEERQKCTKQTSIPQIRKYPKNSASCDVCKDLIQKKNNLRLYSYVKGQEALFFQTCSRCSQACKQEARSCPGIEEVTELLKVQAIRKNAVATKKR